MLCAGACVQGADGPRRPFARKVDMGRPGDHPDVLRYRYSNGLCPDVYQVRGCAYFHYRITNLLTFCACSDQ